MNEETKLLMGLKEITSVEKNSLIEMQARDAYETFMSATYGPNSAEPWRTLPEYARAGWRQVILKQDIETPLDTKYHLAMVEGRPRIQSTNSGEVIPEDEPVMLFRARDVCFLPTLVQYANLCRLAGCDTEHLAGITECMDLFRKFRDTHPDRMKRPGDHATPLDLSRDYPGKGATAAAPREGKTVHYATSEGTTGTSTHPVDCTCLICKEPPYEPKP